MAELKFTGLAQVGDTIKGYDWEPALERGDLASHRESYVEGVVVEACCFDRPSGDRCQDYKVRITKRMLAGREIKEERGELGWIPHQVAIFEWDGRIELVKKA